MRKAFAHIPRTTLLAGIMLMALASCKPKRPAGVLSPSQMENLLVDYHLAQGMAEAESNGRNTDELRYIYIWSITAVTPNSLRPSVPEYAPG